MSNQTGRNAPCPCGSGRKYKKCCIDKSKIEISTQNNKSARRHPILTPDVPPFTFEDIVAKLESVKIDPIQLASSLVDFCCTDIAPNGIAGKEPLYTVWHLGALILAAFASKQSIPYIRHDSFKRIPDNALKEVLFYSGGLMTAADKARELSEEHDFQRNKLLVLRMMCTQFSLQGNFETQLARTLYLLGFEENGPTTSMFDTLYMKKYGCSTIEYMASILALWSLGLKKTILRPSKLLEQSSRRLDFESALKKIIDNLACPAGSIKDHILLHRREAEADALVHSFFTTTPFIKLDEDCYLNPPHPFLRLASLSGAFFNSIGLARDEAIQKRKSHPETNEYSKWVGKERFEPLVSMMMRKFSMSGHARLWTEHEYIHKKNMLSPDFIIFEKVAGRKAVTLVQVKLKRLSRRAFYGFDLTGLEKDINEGLGDLVSKSVGYLRHLHSAYLSGKLNESARESSLAVLEADEIFFLGVVPMMPPVFMFTPYRRQFEEQTFGALKQEDLAWLETNRARMRGWHIIDFEELSFFASGYCEQGFFNTFMKYLTQGDFGKILTTSGLHPSFQDWYKHEYNGQVLKPAEEIERLYRWFTSLAPQLLGLKKNSGTAGL